MEDSWQSSRDWKSEFIEFVGSTSTVLQMINNNQTFYN